MLLVDSEVQALMQRMLHRGSYSIQPKVDSKGVGYPELSSLFPKKSENEIRRFLDRLIDAKILTPKLLDKIISCPVCYSASIYSKYNCPRCNSFDIGKSMIVEHVRCGYMGSLEKFQKEDGPFCPKCRNLVSELDFRKIGISFECNSCGSRFEAPGVSHKCNSCDNVFTYKEAKYEPIHELELSSDTKRQLAQGKIPLETIASMLGQNGYQVGIRTDLVGKSGATHRFDIIAKKGSSLVVANFAFEPKEEDIISLFAKRYDIDPSFTLLITLSPPTKDQDAVATAYGVRILYAAGLIPIAQQIVDLMGSTSPTDVDIVLDNKSKAVT